MKQYARNIWRFCIYLLHLTRFYLSALTACASQLNKNGWTDITVTNSTKYAVFRSHDFVSCPKQFLLLFQNILATYSAAINAWSSRGRFNLGDSYLQAVLQECKRTRHFMTEIESSVTLLPRKDMHDLPF